jgi:DNA-binding transcriptional regulator of glucitol operon
MRGRFSVQLAIILCAILLVQQVFSLIQIRSYRKNIDKIVSGYKGDEGYFMFSGMDRGKFRPGAIAILVVDKRYIVHECHMLKGVSILSKFKELEKYKGQHVGVILNDVNESDPTKGQKKKMPAIGKALSVAGENALVSISRKNTSLI